MPRALPFCLALLLSLSAAAADVGVGFGMSGPAWPGEQAFLTATVFNTTPNEPADIYVRLSFDPTITVEQVTVWPYLWECRSGVGFVDCTNPDFRSGADGNINLVLRFPATGDYQLEATVNSTTPDPNLANNTATTSVYVIRQAIVTNTNDSGPGSLRAAIEDANAACERERPCEIRFRIPSNSRPVIEPLSPLPAITACGVVIGDRPSFYGNPPPLQVEINGRRVQSGPGLELRHACSDRILAMFGVAVNDFPEDGVVITAPLNYQLIGFEARRNGRRGITVESNGWLTLGEAVIGENARSGVALLGGRALIFQSRIGIGPQDEDLANGASGVFIAPAAWDLTVIDSIIANNNHFGLALAGRTDVRISGATVVKHNTSDVDWFLDGPSAPARADIPNTPRVLSASYDAAANTTRVTVTLDSTATTANRNVQIWLYASHGVTMQRTAHLEKLVGIRSIAWKSPIDQQYVVDVPGDLRGRFVSAVTTFWTVQEFPDTPSPAMSSLSEVSEAMKVE